MAISFESFSESELARLQSNMKRRFSKCGVFEIGFGQATKAGKRDRSRPFCVCLYVKRKRTPRSRKAAIPREFKFQFKRDGAKKAETMVAVTDVVEMPETMVPTGRILRRAGTGRHVTTGIVISWRTSSSSSREWGLVTVGHYFPRNNPANRDVRIQIIGGAPVDGQFLSKATRAQKVDAAIISVRRNNLVTAGLIPSSGNPQLNVTTIDRIKRDIGSRGRSLIPPRNSSIAIEFDHYFPQYSAVARLGPITNVVRVESRATNPFRGGRSGSVFLNATGEVSLMQYAGTEGTGAQGLGQSMLSIMAWVTLELQRNHGLVSSSLRLVSRF